MLHRRPRPAHARADLGPQVLLLRHAAAKNADANSPQTRETRPIRAASGGAAEDPGAVGAIRLSVASDIDMAATLPHRGSSGWQRGPFYNTEGAGVAGEGRGPCSMRLN